MGTKTPLISPPMSCQPAEGKAEHPYFFSTNGGKNLPRFLRHLKPAPVVRTDVVADIKAFVHNLRTKWPQQCFSIFTNPELQTGFDPRWFFDEYDDHVLGRKFLFDVICTIIKENEQELFKFVRTWSSENAHKYDQFAYILWQGIDFVFDPQDRVLRGEEFLRRALEIMRQAYEKASIEAVTQDFSAPTNRVTTGTDPSNPSRFPTAEDNAGIVHTTTNNRQRAASNITRGLNTSNTAARWTPSTRSNKANTVPTFDNIHAPVQSASMAAQDRSCVALGGMNNAFQNQVPPLAQTGQYSLSIPPPPPLNHPIGQGPLQYHPCNIPRIPAHELNDNMPPFSYDSGTLPFPGVPILQHPQDTGPLTGGSLPPMTLFHPQYTNAMYTNTAPPIAPPQHLTSAFHRNNEPLFSRDESTPRSFHDGDRHRGTPAIRGRGRGSFSNRGRRFSSGQVNENGYMVWSKPMTQHQRPAMPPDLFSPSDPPRQQLSEGPKMTPGGHYHNFANGRVEHAATTIDEQVPGAAKGNMPTSATMSHGSQNLTSAENLHRSTPNGFAQHAGPAPRDEAGNIDSKKVLGPQYVGENVEDLHQLFVSGVRNVGIANVKAFFEPSVVVGDVRPIRDGANAFVEFHSTADIKSVLKRAQNGRLVAGDRVLYIEVPRYRQHEEFASSTTSKWKGNRTHNSQHSSQKRTDVCDSKGPEQLLPATQSESRTPPNKKHKAKTPNNQRSKITYSPQDARSQVPPSTDAQDPSIGTMSPKQLPISEIALESSCPANRASYKEMTSNSRTFPVKASDKQVKEQILEENDPGRPSELNVLRQVQNHASQDQDETAVSIKAQGSTKFKHRPPPLELQNANFEDAKPYTRSAVVQDAGQEPNVRGRRNISKSVIPALPLKSPPSTKNLSTSQDSDVACQLHSIPEINAEVQNEISNVDIARREEDTNTPKLSLANIERRADAVGGNVAIKTPSMEGQSNSENDDNGDVRSALKTEGNVNNSQSHEFLQGTKTTKAKRKRKEKPTAPTTAAKNATSYQGIATDRVGQSHRSLNNSQDPATAADQKDTIDISNTSKDETLPSNEESIAVVPADLDQSWKTDYDKMMSNLLAIDHHFQEDVAKEAIKLKKDIDEREVKIIAGDQKAQSASQRKTWRKRRRVVLDEYNSLTQERLPMLISRLHQAGKVNQPPSDITNTTSPSSSIPGNLTPSSELQCTDSASQRHHGSTKSGTEVCAKPIKSSTSARSSSLPGLRGIQYYTHPTTQASQTWYCFAVDSAKGIDQLIEDASHRGFTTENTGQSLEIDKPLCNQAILDVPKTTSNAPGSSSMGLGILGLAEPGKSGEKSFKEPDNESLTDELQPTEDLTTSNAAPETELEKAPQNDVRGILRGGATTEDTDAKASSGILRAVSPSSEVPRSLSYASVAKKSLTGTRRPSTSNYTICNTKEKSIETDTTLSGTAGSMPTSPASSPLAMRANNASKGKPNSGGDENWAVKQGEQVWGDQGFQQFK